MSDELSSLIKESFQLIEKKDYKSAVELLYPKLAEYLDNIELITQIAQCYYCMGEIEQAEQYYEKAFEINNYLTLILDPLIDIKIEMEKYNEAEKYAQYYLSCKDKIYAIQKYLETLTTISNYTEIDEFLNTADFSTFNSESYRLAADAIIEIYKNDENPKKTEKVYDYADVLTESEKQDLRELITKYTDNTKCNLKRLLYLYLTLISELLYF